MLVASLRVHRTYVGRLERGRSGVTVEALAAILAALSVSLRELFKPFKEVVRPRAAGPSPHANPLPYPFGRINS